MNATAIGPESPLIRQQESGTGWFLEGCLGQDSGLTRTRIGKVPFSIGRGSRTDFCLPSANVSGTHAEIITAGEAVLVRDAGSTNGTYVNGHRIAAATPVGDGDLLQFADMEFRLRRATAVSGEHTAVAERPADGWLISQLYEVIHHDRFTMVFQPIVSADHLQPMAWEALVRCSVAGLESPLKLFQAAARLGLEERVSSLCREKAVTSVSDLSQPHALFVNTHPNEYLGPELLQSLKELQSAAGSRPLVLEIHEAAVPDLGSMRDFRAALKDLGIGLAYDDFGAGQSRLLELTKVPPDYLKFDRSLLQDIATASPHHHNLIRTLLQLATDAGVATVAEGLDDQAMVDTCRELGFHHLQGYHLARPMPAAELDKT